MKQLFAHVFPAFPHVASAEPAAMGAPDSRRWVFRDLVVRRSADSAWGLSGPAATGSATPRSEPAAEPPWPDTQPCWHE